MIKIDKVSAAERQIGAAIRLLFAGEDPIAALSLASGARIILKDIAKEHGDCPWHDQIEQMVRPEKRKEFWRAINGPYNFLKHAAGDPDAVLSIDDMAVDYAIASALEYFRCVAKRLTTEMTVFYTWFIVLNPDIMKHEMAAAEIRSHPIFASMRGCSREHNLSVANDVLRNQLSSRVGEKGGKGVKTLLLYSQ